MNSAEIRRGPKPAAESPSLSVPEVVRTWNDFDDAIHAYVDGEFTKDVDALRNVMVEAGFKYLRARESAGTA